MINRTEPANDLVLAEKDERHGRNYQTEHKEMACEREYPEQDKSGRGLQSSQSLTRAAENLPMGTLEWIPIPFTRPVQYRTEIQAGWMYCQCGHKKSCERLCGQISNVISM